MYKYSSTKKQTPGRTGDRNAHGVRVAYFLQPLVAQKATAGFSLLEMLVTVSIFVILSTTLLVSYSGINKHLNVDTLTHQVGQWVRDAQVSAMSVRSAANAAGTYAGFGVHFDFAQKGKFTYFADINGNRRYDDGGAACGNMANIECENEIFLSQGNTIFSLCGNTADAGAVYTVNCVNPNAASSVFDIVFTRPDPDARISGDLNGAGFPKTYSSARITITSLKGYRRTVEVWVTGQISVQ